MANFNLNKVILGGRVSSDVELKQTVGGVSVCSFSLAVNRRPARDGTAGADFFNVVAWRQTAEFVSKYFSKGSAICVIGSLQKRFWNDQRGVKHTETDIIADEVYFVDGKAAPGDVSFSAPRFESISADDDVPF